MDRGMIFHLSLKSAEHALSENATVPLLQAFVQTALTCTVHVLVYHIVITKTNACIEHVRSDKCMAPPKECCG
jgi:hypothetical protein